MMNRYKEIVAIFLLVFAALASCDSHFSLGRETGTVSLELELTGIVVSNEHATSLSVRRLTSSAVVGNMTVVDVDTGSTAVYDWYASIDEDQFSLGSSKTIVLDSGYYNFYLELDMGSHRYIGEADARYVNAGENYIAMEVVPAIGDVTVAASVEEIPSLQAGYPVDELGTIDDPVLYIRIDGGEPEICRFNDIDGLGDLFVNVAPGSHEIALELYDGAFQIGRSVPEQESVYVDPGVDIHMDLTPLYGETMLALDMASSQARFSFAIPDEVVVEAGDAANLEVVFKLSGDTSGFQQTDLEVVTSAQGYVAQALLSDMQFDTVDVSLEFIDIATGDLLGSCVLTDLDLTSEDQFITWPLELRRRSVLTGDLLGVVAMNVFYPTGAPAVGATVYANGALIGLTGSGFGTEGYLRLLLPSGTYSLYSEISGFSGNASMQLDPLELSTVDIVMTEVGIGF